MSQREELLALLGKDPAGVVDRFLELQAEKARVNQALSQTQTELVQAQGDLKQTQGDLTQAQLDLKQTQLDLAEAKGFIAELTRQLFGQKADKLSPEQEEQLQEVAGDLQEQAQRATPISRQCLEEELEAKPKLQKERSTRKRHPFPINLETLTVTLEPKLPACQHGGFLRKIGQEVTEELDFIAAKLILRRIVRNKYASGCAQCGVMIAPLAPRLFPQSKLGLGLAVFITLSRFDDHLSYYKLEQNFLERYGVVIARQQMVQWIDLQGHLGVDESGDLSADRRNQSQSAGSGSQRQGGDRLAVVLFRAQRRCDCRV
jgi:transposase